MAEIILHHYPMSPFAEKMRAMLAYSGLTWHSVVTQEMPPRPHLAELAGGYRRIPVAQMGADVFCDTHIIASEIAALSGYPQLAVEGMSEAAVELMRQADEDVFFACILAASGWPILHKARQSLGFVDLLKFFWDRIGMGRSMSKPVVSAKQAPVVLRAFLQQLEQQLSAPFFFGDQPCHADFSVYHCLWFVRDLGEKKYLEAFPRVTAFMDRVKAFNNGSRKEMSISQALEQARTATPRAIPDADRNDPLMGRSVAIAPSDYAQTPTHGELVGSTPQRWILARNLSGGSRVHVHFPKHGFALQPV